MVQFMLYAAFAQTFISVVMFSDYTGLPAEISICSNKLSGISNKINNVPHVTVVLKLLDCC